MLERFIKYVKITTTSKFGKNGKPNNNGQKKLASVIVKELKSLKLDKVYFDKKHCFVYGLLKGDNNLPKLGFISHLDTSNDRFSKDVKVNIIENYDGNDIILNDKVVIKTNKYTDLKEKKGKTIITSDGNNLLGADNKAGICEIISMLEYFCNNNCKHGDIYVCFNSNEELGIGSEYLNKKYFSPDIAFCIDGNALGDLSYENLNSALAEIKINGIMSHYGYAKDIMINASYVACLLNSMLPNETPMNTDGLEGFYHLKKIKGDISRCNLEYLISDFDIGKFEARKKKLTSVISKLNNKYKGCINYKINDLYYNVKDIILKKKDIIDKTIDIIENTGVYVKIVPNRGCTDGPGITNKGITCFTIGTGAHNYHSLYEYVCLEDMEMVSKTLIELVKKW